MKNNFKNKKCGFALYINDHIICERWFYVKYFNSDVKYSTEIKILMDNISGMNNREFGKLGIIPSHLKNLSANFLWEKHNPYKQSVSEVRNIFENEDRFTFEVKTENETLATSYFSANNFPSEIRTQVDIKDIIPAIVSEIKYFFSLESYEHNYLDYAL